MIDFLTTAGGPFGATFVLCLIALGMTAILREGTGEYDQRSFSSSLASYLGILGMILLPLSAIGLVWIAFRSAILIGHAPTITGMIFGLIAAFFALGRQAFRLKSKHR